MVRMEEEKIFEELMAKNFKFDDNYKPRDPRIPSIRHTKKTTSRHVIIKLLKTNHKEKILEEARGKKIHYLEKNKHKSDGRLLVSNNVTQRIVG